MNEAMGLPVTHVVAPDPRWKVLHELWLADKQERNRRKVAKDRAHGSLLLEVVRRAMPHYPLDDAFLREVPDELRR